MLTMRPIEPNGSWGAKSKKEYLLDESGEKIRLKSGEYKSKKVDATDWNDQSNVEIWRQGWAELCNEYLAHNDVAERIDHRSYERQGIDLIPTIHLGMAATGMERRGIHTERGDMNREIDALNKQLRQMKARIRKLEDWVKDERTTTADFMGSVL